MDVEHATKLAEAFNAQNLTSAVIHGALPKDKRKQLLKDFHDGKIRVLTNCQVLTEGWDEPKVNCIAEGQLVLTDKGYVAIEDVTKTMKVWDGVAFVSHDGVIYQGERDVITYAGLSATPDHEVWTRQGWKPLSQVAMQGLEIAVTGKKGQVLLADNQWKSGSRASTTDLQSRAELCLAGLLLDTTTRVSRSLRSSATSSRRSIPRLASTTS